MAARTAPNSYSVALGRPGFADAPRCPIRSPRSHWSDAWSCD